MGDFNFFILEIYDIIELYSITIFGGYYVTQKMKVLRPKTTKIQKKNGIGYVYQVIGKSYKKDKKYTVENRKLIGKMIDEEWMIPNEYFEQYYPDVCVEQETPDFSDTLRIGCFLSFKKYLEICRLKMCCYLYLAI